MRLIGIQFVTRINAFGTHIASFLLGDERSLFAGENTQAMLRPRFRQVTIAWRYALIKKSLQGVPPDPLEGLGIAR